MDTYLIQFIADYGIGDPAFNEVIQRLRFLLPNVEVYPVAVPKFDTLATGFWIYQLGLNHHPEKYFIYANTAPRKDKKEARQHNEGEGLLYGKLDNGVELAVVNSGFSFSFVKSHLTSLKHIKVANKGSQFRSRDFYPEAVQALLRGNHKKVVGEDVPLAYIPDLPSHRVMWIDGYENIKTSIRKSIVQYSAGAKIRVTINNVKRTALVTGGIFEVAEGELAFSPGSSGHEDPFMELFLRGGSAKQLFELERAGNDIVLEEI